MYLCSRRTISLQTYLCQCIKVLLVSLRSYKSCATCMYCMLLVYTWNLYFQEFCYKKNSLIYMKMIKNRFLKLGLEYNFFILIPSKSNEVLTEIHATNNFFLIFFVILLIFIKILRIVNLWCVWFSPDARYAKLSIYIY